MTNRALMMLLCASISACATADPERIAEIANMLPAQPEGPGRPAADRAVWQPIADGAAGQAAIARAHTIAATGVETQPDELFLEYSRNGNRNNWQRVAFRNRSRISTMVVGEALEHQGNFIVPIEEAIRALCAEPTWVYPAHDASLANFRGETVDIDLGSSDVGWMLANTLWVLGDQLSPQVQQLIRDNVAARITGPYRDMIEGRRNKNWWMTTTNNWNSVCVAGCIGAALITETDRLDRAVFVAEAEEGIKAFLRGFTADGYCSEGLGYWNYGFGHYVRLAEHLAQATGGQIDLLGWPESLAPSQFARGILIQGTVSPAFADCAVNARADTVTTAYLDRRFGWGDGAGLEDAVVRATGLQTVLLYGLPNSLSNRTGDVTPPPMEPYTYFDQAGILISRPRAGEATKMAVALKGGHNSEHHNHNDIGSYVVVVGSSPVLLDPGLETYTARTFSGRRYESNLLNSYGHPVPRVDGKLQRTGQQARAEVHDVALGDDVDRLSMSLRSCYDVPQLETLDRHFAYDRAGDGSLTVVDEVAFSEPTPFETALVCAGAFRETAPGVYQAGYLGEVVEVTIDTAGVPYSVEFDEIIEDSPIKPTRLGIVLDDPVTAATVTVTVRPVALPDAAVTGNYLRDGNFANAEWFWRLNPLSSIADLPGGGRALRLTDDSTGGGADATSTRSPVPAATNFTLRGRSQLTAGEGVGVYVRFFDAAGERIGQPDAQGNEAPVGTLTAGDRDWQAFAFPVASPADAAEVEVWIHSFNAALVEGLIADLALEVAQ